MYTILFHFIILVDQTACLKVQHEYQDQLKIADEYKRGNEQLQADLTRILETNQQAFVAAESALEKNCVAIRVPVYTELLCVMVAKARITPEQLHLLHLARSAMGITDEEHDHAVEALGLAPDSALLVQLRNWLVEYEESSFECPYISSAQLLSATSSNGDVFEAEGAYPAHVNAQHTVSQNTPRDGNEQNAGAGGGGGGVGVGVGVVIDADDVTDLPPQLTRAPSLIRVHTHAVVTDGVIEPASASSLALDAVVDEVAEGAAAVATSSASGTLLEVETKLPEPITTSSLHRQPSEVLRSAESRFGVIYHCATDGMRLAWSFGTVKKASLVEMTLFNGYASAQMLEEQVLVYADEPEVKLFAADLMRRGQISHVDTDADSTIRNEEKNKSARKHEAKQSKEPKEPKKFKETKKAAEALSVSETKDYEAAEKMEITDAVVRAALKKIAQERAEATLNACGNVTHFLARTPLSHVSVTEGVAEKKEGKKSEKRKMWKGPPMRVKVR